MYIWISFFLLTILIVLSFKPICHRHFESVLEHVTAGVAGKDMTLNGRENAVHMQWIASQVHYAMERVPESTLQVNIYITDTMSKRAGKRLAIPTNINRFTVDSLHPGHTNILGYGSSLSGNTSKASLASTDTDVEVLGEADDIIDSYSELGHEEHVPDMTDFGGRG